MSVISVIEIGEELTSEKASTAPGGVDEFVREFTVRTSSPSVRASTVKKGNGVPRLDERYGVGTALCYRLTAARNKNNATVWRVRAYYRGDTLTRKESGGYVNQLVYQPPKVRTNQAHYQIPMAITIDKKPIVNSTGVPFARRPLMDASDPTVEVSRFESDSYAITSARYANAVNFDTFMGSPPRTVKIMDLNGERFAMKTAFGWLYYWKATYLFRFKKETWDKEILDEGFYQKEIKHWDSHSAETGKIERITDVHGSPVVTPVRLDGKGQPLEKVTDPSVFLTFKVYKELSFRALQMPQLRVIL